MTNTESRIKRLWKNRISHQFTSTVKTGFQLNATSKKEDSYVTTISHTDSDYIEEKVQVSSDTPTMRKKLWRKPLPNDCPVFDFDNTTTKENTLIEQQDDINTTPPIPPRHSSYHYTVLLTRPNLHNNTSPAVHS